MLIEALTWLEASDLGRAARASVWLYPAANLAHVVGSAMVLGAIAVLDVLLMRGRSETAAAVAGTAIPIAATGILVQIATGVVLLAAEASATGLNPAFLVKLGLIGLGLANVAWFHVRRDGWAEGAGRMHAAVSLAAWTGAVLAGRAIAYV